MMINVYNTLKGMIPDGESTFGISATRCRFEGRPSVIVPTEKRLLTCKYWLRGLFKSVNDFSWSQFDHASMTQKFWVYTIELRRRDTKRVLKIEWLNKADFEALYRRIQERISVYDEKSKLSSRKCPTCREVIDYHARECPHCHRELPRVKAE